MKERHPCQFEIWGLEIELVEIYFFLENYVTSEGAVSHNGLYYQLRPITRYQVRVILLY